MSRFALSLGLAFLIGVPLSGKARGDYTFLTIDFAGDTFTQLLGVNNALTIAGYHGATINKGLVFSNNTFTDENFPNSAQTQVVGINQSGTTVGFYIDNEGINHGFVDHEGNFINVDFPDTMFNQLLGLNDLGVAAGYYMDAAGNDHGYLVTFPGVTFTQLPIPGVSNQATGVNNQGDVCGFYIDAGGVNHGFLLSGNSFLTLDFPGSTFTQALGLNNYGHVVGAYMDAMGLTHGFVYRGGGIFVSIDAPNGVGITTVNGTNDFGDLVGFYGPVANTQGFLAISR